MKVAIVGSRQYPALTKVIEYVRSLPADTVVVSGGAAGVDSLAERQAKARGLQTLIFLPDWKRYGKSAGFRRNRDIVAAADKVVAFWDGHSRGTANDIALAREMGKELEIVLP